ncbi:hypothetical protein Tco_0940834 [Tanacetum coccineum]|uniref:Uncharacterized protein n=1 Tax=Tanacetum coccineum TaxID=301880 RepID=A0ABQ5DPK3_9ASTR
MKKDNRLYDLKVLVSNVNDRSCEPYNANDVTDLLEQNERLRAEIEKVKQHYKEMFESIKITRTSTNEQTSSLLTQIEDLKAQLEGNLKVCRYNYCRNNKNLSWEIVEEARVVKPLDNVLNYACQYTKLLKNCTSTNNTQKHGVHQKTQPSNVQVSPSTGVSSSTRASGSKPRSNTKHNRILPAKSVSCDMVLTMSANQQDPNTNWGSEISNPPNSTVFNAVVTDHPLVSGLRLFKTRFRGINGSCTHQFRTRAYHDDPWTTQFRARPSHVPATTYIPPTDKDLEILFQPMFDEYFDQSTDSEPVPTATVVNAPIVSTSHLTTKNK